MLPAPLNYDRTALFVYYLRRCTKTEHLWNR